MNFWHAVTRLAFTIGLLSLAGTVPCLAFAQDVQRSAQQRRELSGTVVDSATRLPLSGVVVSLPVLNLNATTDSKGRFALAGFLPAATTVVVREVGYATYTRRVDLPGASVSLVIELPKRIAELETVRVHEDTVARFLDAKQATSSMSAADVREKRGQTLGETLKELPGVSIIQYGPSIAKPVVRGLHSQRIATVNAGVPQEGQQWGGEHAPEIDAFAANEIQVIRGPGTILYGSGALGGVVLVQPRPLPTSGTVDGELSTNGFLNNRQGAASLMLEGGRLPALAAGTLGWRLQLTARRAGDAKAPNYFLPNTGFRELDASGAIGLTRTWGRFEIDVSHFGTNLGLYLGAHVGNLDDLDRAMRNAFTTQGFAYTLAPPNQRVDHDVLTWRTNLLLPHSARFDISYGFQHNNRREYDNHGLFTVASRPAFALELFTHSLDMQYHTAPGTRWSSVFGLSGMRQGNLSVGRSFLIPQYRLYTGGIFGLENVEISRLTLTAGARYDYRWQHAYQYGEPVVISPDDVHAYQGFSGNLGASLRMTDSWSLASTVGSSWRPPNVNERFSQGVHHGTAQYEIGDSSLVPERSRNADLTLRHQGARTRLEISTYANVIDDFIFLKPRDPVITVRGAYPGYVYSHADALLRGSEITAQFAPVWWVQLYANGNLVRGTDRSTSIPLYDMPADRATVSARFFGASGRRAVAPFVEIGGTLVRQQDQLPTVTIYKLPTAGYALLNFEVGATTLRLGAIEFEPSLTVRNVLDTRYRDYLSRYRLFVDEPGRDVILRVTAPFGHGRRGS